MGDVISVGTNKMRASCMRQLLNLDVLTLRCTTGLCPSPRVSLNSSFCTLRICHPSHSATYGLSSHLHVDVTQIYSLCRKINTEQLVHDVVTDRFNDVAPASTLSNCLQLNADKTDRADVVLRPNVIDINFRSSTSASMDTCLYSAKPRRVLRLSSMQASTH
jgi:hypothetical protein